MSAPAALLSLLFLTSTPDPAPARIDSRQEFGARRITAIEDMTQQPREVRISPGRGLLLVFDTPLQREGFTLEARESFRQVSLSDDGLLLTLMPSRELPLGRRLSLRLRFVDGIQRVSLDISLVVSPQADSQLEIFRRPLPEVAQARLQQCQLELAQERSERASPSGLSGLLAAEQLTPRGVLGKRITFDLTAHPGDDLSVKRATSYLAPTEDKASPVVRLAVDLQLKNRSQEAWKPAHARLITPQSEWTAEVWSPKPIQPGAQERVLVEVELPGSAAPGPSVLTLWNEDKTRTATFSGVTFPADQH